MKKICKTCYRNWKQTAVLVIAFFLLAGILLFETRIPSKADGAKEITHGVAGSDTAIPSEIGKKGTETNPFVILEIVTDYSFAEMGYLVGGCEPIDVDNPALHVDNEMCGLIPSVSSLKTKQTTKIKETLSKDDIAEKWTHQTNWNPGFYGYYEKVEAGTGNYSYKNNKFTKTTGGDFVLEIVSMKEWGKNYKTNISVKNVGDKSYQLVDLNDWYINYAYYEIYQENQFLKSVLDVDEEDIPDYHVVIRTITPEDLKGDQLKWIDRADLMSIAARAHVGSVTNLNIKYDRLGRNLSKPNNTHIAFSDKEGKDLSWDAVERIYNKIVGTPVLLNSFNSDKEKEEYAKLITDDYAAIIMDTTVKDGLGGDLEKHISPVQFGFDKRGKEVVYDPDYSQTGTCNNTYKLLLMLSAMDMNTFYNVYMNPDNGAEYPFISATTVNVNGHDKKTGFFAKQTPNGKATSNYKYDEQIYWGTYTFLPSNPDGTYANMAACNKESYKKHYGVQVDFWSGIDTIINDHVYIFNGNTSLTQSFLNNCIGKNNYNGEFFDYMDENELNHGKDNTPAIAVKYILGYTADANGTKAGITVLDIEPGDEFSTSIKNAIRIMVPKYRGTITVVTMSSSKFNGMTEDISATYDMIYIGGTTLNQLDDDDMSVGNKNTKFYDSSMNKKLYYHQGDVIEVQNPAYANWISGADKIRLPGNDITESKVEALKQFLKKGAPILYQSELSYADNMDTKSNIYKFIKKYSSDSSVVLKKVTDTGASNEVYTALGTMQPILSVSASPVYDGENQTGYLNDNEANQSNRTATFTFSVSDGYTVIGGPDSAYSYNAYDVNVYTDLDKNGRFSDKEKVSTSKDKITADGSEITITADFGELIDSDFVGALPWRLEVRKSDKEEIVASVQGVTAIKLYGDKETKTILQIVNNEGSPIDLEAEYGNTSSKLYQYLHSLNDFSVEFKTMTVAQYEALFNTKFDNSSSSKKFSTDKLNGYDMIVLGFSGTGDFVNISNQNGAVDNLYYYISLGKSVLFTNGNTSAENNKLNTSAQNAATSYGYNLNLLARDILSADRFGVRTKIAMEQCNPKPLEENYRDATGAIDKDAYEADLALYEAKKETIKDSKDSTDNPEKQGYSAYGVKQLAKTNQKLVSNGKVLTNSYATTTTETAALNYGQINAYPYAISELVTIPPAHAQPYELEIQRKVADVTTDDLTVWYALTDDAEDDNIYSSDFGMNASSDYFIYSNRNITYCGFGQSTWTSDEQVKLFINTLVLAYSNSGLPKITVTNEERLKISNIEYYVYSYDDLKETTDADGNTTVQVADASDTYIEFVPSSPNSTDTNKDVYVKAVLADTSTGIHNVEIYRCDVDADGHYTSVGSKVAVGDDGYCKLIDGKTYLALYKGEWANTSLDSKIVNFDIYDSLSMIGICKVRVINRTIFNLN